MSPQLCFFVSIACSLVAWGIVTVNYIRPELRKRPRAEALRPLLVLHSFRFCRPGIPGAGRHVARSSGCLRAFRGLWGFHGDASRVAFIAGTANKIWRCHGLDLQSLGLSRPPECFLPGQCRRNASGTIGGRLLYSDVHCAAAADHPRFGFLDSSATSKPIRDAANAAAGVGARVGYLFTTRLGRRTARTLPLLPPPRKNRSLLLDSSPDTPVPGGLSSFSRTSAVLD